MHAIGARRRLNARLISGREGRVGFNIDFTLETVIGVRVRVRIRVMIRIRIRIRIRGESYFDIQMHAIARPGYQACDLMRAGGT